MCLRCRTKRVTRPHAELVAGDSSLFKSFLRVCRRDAPTKSGGPCIADEHYVQSLLAYHKRESELMRRSVTFALWNEGFMSPETFGENNIKSRIREIQGCHAVPDSKGTGARKFQTWHSSDDCGRNLDSVTFDGLGGEPLDLGEPDDTLDGVELSDASAPVVRRERPCYLFARKFSPDAVSKILSASTRIVGV